MKPYRFTLIRSAASFDRRLLVDELEQEAIDAVTRIARAEGLIPDCVTEIVGIAVMPVEEGEFSVGIRLEIAMPDDSPETFAARVVEMGPGINAMADRCIAVAAPDLEKHGDWSVRGLDGTLPERDGLSPE